MGAGFCGEASFEDKKNPDMEAVSSSSQLRQEDSSDKPKVDCGKNKLTVRAKLFYAPPVLNGDEVILLYTNLKKKCTKYRKFNLTQDKYKLDDAVDIKCDDDFNIYNTVYALNENDGKIYFIENNSKLSALDLNTNTIQSLDKTITTTNNNYANIVYDAERKKMYILGAENEEKGDDLFEYVPYSTAMKKAGDNEYKPGFIEFGRGSKAFNVEFEGKDCIFTLGGQTKWPQSDDEYLPNDTFGRYVVPKDGAKANDDNKENSNGGWKMGYLPQPAQRCGVINYKNEYLITFGGDIMKQREVRPKSGMVYVSPLKKDNKYKLDVMKWYELPKLAKQGHYHAIYKDEIIYLFNYYGYTTGKGKLYKIGVESILKELKREDKNDNEGGYKVLTPWTEQGKTAIPGGDAAKNRFPTMEPDGGDSDEEEK